VQQKLTAVQGDRYVTVDEPVAATNAMPDAAATKG
jgi:hypothetical protein